MKGPTEVTENGQSPSTTTPPAPATGSPVEPVSTRISLTVPADKVVEFDALLHEVVTAARGFAGHLGVDVLRPERRTRRPCPPAPSG